MKSRTKGGRGALSERDSQRFKQDHLRKVRIGDTQDGNIAMSVYSPEGRLQTIGAAFQQQQRHIQEQQLQQQQNMLLRLAAAADDEADLAASSGRRRARPAKETTKKPIVILQSCWRMEEVVSEAAAAVGSHADADVFSVAIGASIVASGSAISRGATGSMDAAAAASARATLPFLSSTGPDASTWSADDEISGSSPPSTADLLGPRGEVFEREYLHVHTGLEHGWGSRGPKAPPPPPLRQSSHSQQWDSTPKHQV